jgi:hypothetical protein
MTMSTSSPNPSLVALLVVGTALSALLGGCGGDARRGEQDSIGAVTQRAPPVPAASRGAPAQVVATPIADPARRAYVARVDSVCGQIDPERGAEQKRVGAAKQVGEAVKAYDDSIALGWRELRRIEAIQPPPGDRSALRANVFDVIRSQLALRRRIAGALAAVNVPRLRALRAEEDNMARALGGFARGYGFRVCGKA